MSLTQAELNEIKERAEKATPGPWGIDFPLLVCDQCGNTYEIVQSDVFLAPVVAESKSEADAEFIAHAREDIPSLLDHIAELEAVINVIREVAAEGYATACTSDEARAYGSIIDVLNRKKGVKE